MQIKKLQCSNCGAVEEIALLPGQTIYRCKACAKLSKVEELSEKPQQVESSHTEEKPKRKKKKKND